MENVNNLKWHQKPLSTTILLILFFPLGIYLMWKNELWSKTARVVISAFFGLLVIGNMNKESKEDACGCVELLLDKPTPNSNIGLTNEEFRKWEKCYDKYSEPAGAILECEKK